MACRRDSLSSLAALIRVLAGLGGRTTQSAPTGEMPSGAFSLRLAAGRAEPEELNPVRVDEIVRALLDPAGDEPDTQDGRRAILVNRKANDYARLGPFMVEVTSRDNRPREVTELDFRPSGTAGASASGSLTATRPDHQESWTGLTRTRFRPGLGSPESD